MCTVTYLPLGPDIVITSNRDEHIGRPAALPPQTYTLHKQQIAFPKDPQGGGSWFAASKKSIVVLLNGANEKHISTPPYRISRGQVVIEHAAAPDPVSFWNNFDLDQIEPFTMIIAVNNNLYQMQWDGSNANTIALNPEAPHIWSSATLYTPEVREMRKKWFAEFLQQGDLSIPAALNFHLFTQNNDSQNGLIVNRNNVLLTQSVCQAIRNSSGTRLNYHDLLTQTIHTHDV